MYLIWISTITRFKMVLIWYLTPNEWDAVIKINDSQCNVASNCLMCESGTKIAIATVLLISTCFKVAEELSFRLNKKEIR